MLGATCNIATTTNNANAPFGAGARCRQPMFLQLTFILLLVSDGWGSAPRSLSCDDARRQRWVGANQAPVPRLTGVGQCNSFAFAPCWQSGSRATRYCKSHLYKRCSNDLLPTSILQTSTPIVHLHPLARSKGSSSSTLWMVSSSAATAVISGSTIRAAITLMVAATMGFGLPRLPLSHPSNRTNVGPTRKVLQKLLQSIRRVDPILTTLLIASAASTLGFAPHEHFLYQWCWTLVPATSLALLLLSLTSRTSSSSSEASRTVPAGEAPRKETTSLSSAPTSTSRQNSNGITVMIATIGRLLLPFGIACAASWTACWSVAQCMRYGWHHSSSAHRVLLSPIAVRVAAACMVASYTGGSVNFMATANIIMNEQSQHQQRTAVKELVCAMNAADIIIMVVYFALMSAAVQSKSMRNWYQPSNLVAVHEQGVENELKQDSQSAQQPNSGTWSVGQDDSSNESNIATTLYHTQRSMGKTLPTAAAFAATVAITLVTIAHRFEASIAQWIPGTACGFLALATPLLSMGITLVLSASPRQAPRRSDAIDTRRRGGVLQSSIQTLLTFYSSKQRRLALFWSKTQLCAGIMGHFCFLFLFAALGVSVDLPAALVGSGPACFVFTSAALSIHALLTLLLSVAVTRVLAKLPTSSRWMDLTDVLVASNAAIGGPTTAAAFSATLPPEQCCGFQDHDRMSEQEKQQEKQGLTVAATAMGVTGNAIGTTIGVALYRILKFQ